ncbi:MAG: hypothetical protein RLZZ303_2623 [Candidatus Hydrogenedentota bacterium]|jgi:predicted dehydrogenase
MDQITRKEFLAATTATIATVSVVGPHLKASAASTAPHRHAVIGCGGQGAQHARVFSSFEDCDVVALCDVDPERRDKLAKALPNTDQVRVEEDYRKILDDDSIVSVSVVTPDHWHTPIAIAALQAGKHVYVEKPCSHTVMEGDALVAAAKASGLCVQHGTQWRGTESAQKGIAWMHEGNLGKVRVAKAINHQLRGPIGRAEETTPPDGVNYDLWLGPAPLRPFTQNRWHYNWHWHWDYGGGDLVNDGIHQVDVARWGLGVGLPKAISGSAAQLFYDDDHETPDTQTITFEYDDCHLLYEMRLWTNYPLEGHDNGVIYYGDKGTLHIGRSGAIAHFKDETVTIGEGNADITRHMRNFLDCIRDHSPEKLYAPIDECHRSATLCNLGNIATRVGRRISFDAATLSCPGDPEATAMLTKIYRAGYELPSIA